MFAALLALILSLIALVQASQPLPTPEPTPVPAPLVAQTSSAVHDPLLLRLNEVRTVHGLKPLIANATLEYIATVRANDMATGAQPWSHINHAGKTAYGQIATISAASCEIIGRNNYPDPVGEVFSAWLRSAAHADCLLDRSFVYAGIESRVSSDGLTYFVVIFSE